MILECTNDAFLERVGLCFLDKFTNLTNPAATYEQDAFNTGRRPLSTHIKSELKDSAVRFNYLVPEMTKRMGDSGRKFMDLLGKLVKSAGEKEHEFLAYEMLRHSNFERVLYDVVTDTVQAFIEPYMDEMHSHHAFAKPLLRQSEVCADVCERPVFERLCTLCELVVGIVGNVDRVVSCLSTFEPIDFENNVAWIKCFYTCE